MTGMQRQYHNRRLCSPKNTQENYLKMWNNTHDMLLNKFKKRGCFIIGWTYNSDRDKLELKKVFDNMIIEDLSIREF